MAVGGAVGAWIATRIKITELPQVGSGLLLGQHASTHDWKRNRAQPECGSAVFVRLKAQALAATCQYATHVFSLP